MRGGHHECADRKSYCGSDWRNRFCRGRGDHVSRPDWPAAGDRRTGFIQRRAGRDWSSGKSQTLSRSWLDAGVAALPRRHLLFAARRRRFADFCSLGPMGSVFRQRAFRSNRNLALFQILDRDGRRADFYRVMGAMALAPPRDVRSPPRRLKIVIARAANHERLASKANKSGEGPRRIIRNPSRQPPCPFLSQAGERKNFFSRRIRRASALRLRRRSWARPAAATRLPSGLLQDESAGSAGRPAFPGRRDARSACPCPVAGRSRW